MRTYLKTNRTLIALMGMALAAATPIATNASPVGIVNSNTRALSGSPLQIESCIVSASLPSPVQNVLSGGVGYLAGRSNGFTSLAVAVVGGGGIALASRRSTLTIRMSNEGRTPITAMRVEAQANGAPVYERENLDLQPGDIVNRTYSGAGFSQNDQPQSVACKVDWVQFADGTTWSSSAYQDGGR
jgi:hypothetical protein